MVSPPIGGVGVGCGVGEGVDVGGGVVPPELPVTVTGIDPTVLLCVVAVIVTFPAFLAVKIPWSPPDPFQLAVLTDRIVVSELCQVVSLPIHVAFPSASLASKVTLDPTAIVVTFGWMVTIG